jgi:hypothetical protein
LSVVLREEEFSSFNPLMIHVLKNLKNRAKKNTTFDRVEKRELCEKSYALMKNEIKKNMNTY